MRNPMHVNRFQKKRPGPTHVWVRAWPRSLPSVNYWAAQHGRPTQQSPTGQQDAAVTEWAAALFDWMASVDRVMAKLVPARTSPRNRAPKP